MLNTKIRSLAGIFWAFLTWFRINFVSEKHEMSGLWILKCQTFCNEVTMDNCSEYYKQFSCNAKLFLLMFLATFPATTINKKNHTINEHLHDSSLSCPSSRMMCLYILYNINALNHFTLVSNKIPILIILIENIFNNLIMKRVMT